MESLMCWFSIYYAQYCNKLTMPSDCTLQCMFWFAKQKRIFKFGIYKSILSKWLITP